MTATTTDNNNDNNNVGASCFSGGDSVDLHATAGHANGSRSAEDQNNMSRLNTNTSTSTSTSTSASASTSSNDHFAWLRALLNGTLLLASPVRGALAEVRSKLGS
jgi:hypothetical protein